jgi:amidohydrolase
MERGMDIRARIEELKEELVGLRRDFHMNPELGFEEHRTAGKVEEYLRALGLFPERIAGTGVTATIKGSGDGPVLMLRADMDALPIQEENRVPYASKNAGVMHACGHDAHTAMLMVTAKLLTELKERFSGIVKLVFQPNEEVAGAYKLIEEGLMKNPDVDAALGIHIWTPVESGKIGVQAGAVMATMDIFRIVVKGRGGHTGYPESAADPVLAASSLVMEAQRIQTREISLMKPTVIMFGKIEGGTKNNIIPDTVTLEGTMRYLYSGEAGSEEDPPARLKRLAEAVCSLHGCSCEVHVERENSAVINDPGMVKLVRETASALVGADNVVEHASMAGEDFSSYASLVPAAFIFLGTGNREKETDYPHHNPRFNIDEDTMLTGVELFIRSVLSHMGSRA